MLERMREGLLPNGLIKRSLNVSGSKRISLGYL